LHHFSEVFDFVFEKGSLQRIKSGIALTLLQLINASKFIL
jgi:hypothetical protein